MAGNSKEPRGLVTGLVVDWEALRREEEALNDIFVGAEAVSSDACEGDVGDAEIRAARALADDGVQKSVDALLRNPLFTGGRITTVHSNGDGYLVTGDLTLGGRSGAAALRMRRRDHLRVVGQSVPSSIAITPLNRDLAALDSPKVSTDRMAPVHFSVEGDDWFDLCEAGTFEEACIFLVRGELELEILDGQHRAIFLCATPDAREKDKSVACAVLSAETAGVALPHIKMRSREGAMGSVVWYSKREVQISRKKILAPNPSSNVAGAVRVVGAHLPVGPAAVHSTLKLPKVDQSNTVHSNGQKGGQFSIHSLPWNEPLTTRSLDVRLVVVPDGAADGEIDLARHPRRDGEMLIPLHGCIIACVAPYAAVKSETSTCPIKELKGVELDRFRAAAVNIEGNYEPSVVFVDSQDFHGLASGTYGTSVCLQILHSEDAKERRNIETRERVKPVELHDKSTDPDRHLPLVLRR